MPYIDGFVIATEWPDKATRDAGMKKMMEDPRMDDLRRLRTGECAARITFSPTDAF